MLGMDISTSSYESITRTYALARNISTFTDELFILHICSFEWE